MKLIKWGITALLGLTILITGLAYNPADVQAVILEKDANPVKMVFTSWGGVCLEREGQQKYFKTWKKDTNKFEKMNIAKSNIQSFDVYGNTLVYLVTNNNFSSVNIYNFDTAQAAMIQTPFSNKRSIKTNGKYVIWEDFGLGKADLAIYNIAAAKLDIIESNHADRLQPAISNNYIAYIDSNNGSTNVNLYSLQTGAKTLIRGDVSFKQSPSLTDNKLVWAELREGAGSRTVTGTTYFDEVWGYITKGNGIYDIWMYNIGDGSTSKITDSGSNKAQPVVLDNLVAYVDLAKGNPDIRLKDLGTGLISSIASSDTYEVQPTMGYGYMSWVALRGNLGDLYIQNLGTGEGNPNTPAAPVSSIKVLIKGQEYAMDPSPYILQDRTMVPMRRIFEILGAAITWDEKEKSVTAIKGNDKVKLTIGEKNAYINGTAVPLSVAAVITPEGRTMIPLRFVAEAFKCIVNWEPTTRVVTIN